MLQDIRANSQGTVAKIIIGLIVISFSIFGIESLLFSNSGSGVAEVNGEEISPFSLQQEVSVQQRQLLAMLGENADPALLDQRQLSGQALETLIQRKIVTVAAVDLGLTTAEQSIAEIITNMEQFWIDGQFSPQMYQSALASAGFTRSLFRERLSEDLLMGQLRAGLAGSDFSTQEELGLAVAIGREGRDVRYITLPLVDFLVAAEVNADEVQSFYNANPNAFQSEENVLLDYLVLSVESYRQPVAEEEIREEFELARSEFEVPRETRVSHILFEGQGDDVAAQVDEMEAALAGGMSFADAARTFSQDVGSAQAGGDLGYTEGETFPDSMEEAIASLGVGERSGLVTTDAGTHFLTVTDRREGSAVSFEDVRAELETRLRDAAAAAALLSDVERLRDIAFNAADLSAPARELGLEVQRSAPVSRFQTDGIFAQPVLLRPAFSEDVLEAGHNSEVIELNPEQFFVLRVAERRMPALRPLAEVQAQIEAQLRDEKAGNAGRAKAEELLGVLEKGSTVEDAANAAGLGWQVELGATRDSLRLPRAVRDKLFTLRQNADEPVRVVVAGGDDDIYLLEFVRVTPGALDAMNAGEREQWSQRVAGETGGLVQQQYEAALRSRADIVVY
ncbi:MAG: peptidyl-prolyl cis-trans isomerase D [Halieaceae bacterium]|jgi:peptidyl-prolyl cis-trans isomerase D